MQHPCKLRPPCFSSHCNKARAGCVFHLFSNFKHFSFLFPVRKQLKKRFLNKLKQHFKCKLQYIFIFTMLFLKCYIYIYSQSFYTTAAPNLSNSPEPLVCCASYFDYVDKCLLAALSHALLICHSGTSLYVCVCLRSVKLTSPLPSSIPSVAFRTSIVAVVTRRSFFVFCHCLSLSRCLFP